MSEKQAITSLFQLPKDETIYESFSCGYKSSITFFGQLYVTDNFLCFFATVLGVQKKIKMSFDDVKEILLEKKIIKIILKDEINHNFAFFSHKKQVFQLIYKIWAGTEYQEKLIDDEDLTNSQQLDQTLGIFLLKKEQENESNQEINIDILKTDENNQKQLQKAKLPISVKKFFELFIQDGCVFSLEDHNKLKGNQDIKLTKWHKQENEQYIRELNQIVKVQGIPYKDKAPMVQIQSYIFENNILKINSTTKMLDIPYCDNFQIEEQMLVSPDLDGDIQDENKCIVQVEVNIQWLKSVIGFIKNKIQEKTLEGIKNDYDLYFSNIEKKFKKKNEVIRKQSLDSQNYEIIQKIDNKEQLINLQCGNNFILNFYNYQQFIKKIKKYKKQMKSLISNQYKFQF